MSKVTNFRDYVGKKNGQKIHIYTLKEFIYTMNGEGYDDSEFKIRITPFADPDDGYIEGWWLSFIHGETGQYCVVAQDDHNGINDFILYHQPIDIIFNILNELSPCEREIMLIHENNYREA